MNGFFDLVKEGFRLAANLGLMALAAVKAAVLGYFNQVKLWSIRLAIAAAAPLVVIVPCLFFNAPVGWLYGTYVVWIVLLVAAELLLLTPVFLIWRRLKVLFPNVVNELQEWLDFIKSVVFNGLSLGIFVTLFPIWRSPGAFPLLLLVLACWVTLPACGFSEFCKRIYPCVRAVQLLLLFGLLVVQMAFPQHVKQMAWQSGKVFGGMLTRSIEQKEITSDWKTLQWFNNQGEPQVWYSGSEEEGFHLWAAPGFDQSNRELQAVADGKIKNRIIARFAEQEKRANYLLALKTEGERRQEQAEKERQAVADAEKAERDRVEKIRLGAEAEKERVALAANEKRARMEAEEQARQLAETQRREYIARHLRPMPTLKGPGKLALAVGVMNPEGRLDETFATQLSAVFPAERVKATGNLFTPASAADGVLGKLLGSDAAELARLGLPAVADRLLLGSYQLQFTTNAQLGGIITAQLQFSGSVLKADTGELQEKLDLEVSGANFRRDLAEVAAKERLAKSFSTRRWQFLPQ